MEVEKQDLNVEEKPAPIWKIITVASIAAGVQFGWALQLSLLTPYVQTLGVPHAYATFVWLCGPISGFIVQPLVGYLSDNCTSRIGRRRPFIIAGAASICTAVFLIGFAKDIGHRAGDALDDKTKGRAVAVFVVGFWILDVSNNMLQGPTRAFLADLSNEDHRMMRIGNSCFSFFMAVGNVLGYAAGSYSKLYNIFPFAKTVACDTTCANLKSCFTIDIVLLVAVVSTACCLVGEKPISRKNKQSEMAENSNFVHQLAKSIQTLKKPVWILLLVTCINWIAWFPFILYDTDWMGREVYGGLPEGTEQQKDLYDRGVRVGALGLLLNSVVLGVSSLGVEPVGRILGGPKNLWGFVNVILGAGLACTVWVTKAAEAWRSGHGLVAPTAHVKGGGLAIFAILGIPLAITYSLPFALASIYCSVAGGGQGLSLGVVNLAIVIPQIIISVVSGPLDKALGGGNLPAFVLGAVAAITSSILAVFMLPKPPKRALSQAPPVLPAAAH